MIPAWIAEPHIDELSVYILDDLSSTNSADPNTTNLLSVFSIQFDGHEIFVPVLLKSPGSVITFPSPLLGYIWLAIIKHVTLSLPAFNPFPFSNLSANDGLSFSNLFNSFIASLLVGVLFWSTDLTFV